MDLKKILSLVDTSSKYLYIKKTLRLIGHSFKLYDLNDLFISYNGGKDAEVVLQLVRIALYQKSLKIENEAEHLEAFNKDWEKIKIVYFEEPNPIPEVDVFVTEQAKRFNFAPIVLGKNVKKETFTLVEKYNMKAIFLGTRRVDPYSASIEVYSPSDMDKDWAPFMRIHPIIDWNYEQVWIFLRDFEIPYCPLYDQGYTHLGNITNSGPNEFLKQADGTYLPAYKADGKYEHFSRTCYKASQDHLDTKHFVIVYKNTMSDILETIKAITVLFGSCPHVSILELKALKEFLGAIKKCEKSKSIEITLVHDKFKVTQEELAEQVENIGSYKVMETSQVK